MGHDDRVGTARTWLFVPADKPAMFAKAADSGADFVVLDLEDAVAPDRKDYARAQAFEWLATTMTPTALRINAQDTPWHAAEVVALAKLVGQVVMIPKAEDPQELADVAARSSVSALVPLIETARGVTRAVDLATVPGVKRLAFGNFDLAAQLGTSPDDEAALSVARQLVVLASAAAGLHGPIDGVTGAIGDPGRVSADAEASRALGFTGKLCIHPGQIAAASAALMPPAAEIAWAKRVREATESAPDGVLMVDGHMVDAPVITRATRILARSNPTHESPAEWRTE